jgi:prevent-host-death family protein
MVNMHDAKTTLSQLVERATAGEEVIIARAGRPVARLIPYEAAPRRPGGLAGRITIADDFDETPAEVLDAFSGEAE